MQKTNESSPERSGVTNNGIEAGIRSPKINIEDAEEQKTKSDQLALAPVEMLPITTEETVTAASVQAACEFCQEVVRM